MAYLPEHVPAGAVVACTAPEHIHPHADPDADLIERMASATWAHVSSDGLDEAPPSARALHRQMARAVLAVVRESEATR